MSTVCAITAPKISRISPGHHSTLVREVAPSTQRLPEQVKTILDVLNGSQYYTVREVILDTSGKELKLIVVEPPHKNSEEGHTEIIVDLFAQNGLSQYTPVVEVDNFNDDRYPNGRIELRF